MRNLRLLNLAVVISISVALSTSDAFAGEPGTAGFLSLRFGHGARAAALGDASVSLATDATAAYWNPGGLANIETTSLAFAHNEWFESLRIETFSVGHATDLGVFGFFFSGLYMDEIPRTQTASSTPLGFFNVFETAYSFVYANTFAEVWQVGGAIKGLYSKLDEETAAGWAVDFGFRFKTEIEGLTFAAAAQNLGPNIAFIAEDFELPAAARIGADYQRPLHRYSSTILFVTDLEFVNDDDDIRSHYGIEYTYDQTLSLRAGVKTGFDSQGGSFGLGFLKNGYQLDYSFSPADSENDLGDIHRFSVGIDL